MGRIIELNHTADMSIRVFGDSFADLFGTAALGMMHLLAEPGQEQSDVTQHSISLSAPDAVTLLVDWLSELLYLSEECGCVFRAVHFESLTEMGLTANAEAVPIGEYKHYIKAVTYHTMHIERINDEWTTAIVFDL